MPPVLGPVSPSQALVIPGLWHTARVLAIDMTIKLASSTVEKFSITLWSRLRKACRVACAAAFSASAQGMANDHALRAARPSSSDHICAAFVRSIRRAGFDLVNSGSRRSGSGWRARKSW